MTFTLSKRPPGRNLRPMSPLARPRIVALVTDFGLDDPYVGVLRGVIKTLSPEAEVLDICHAVRPGDRYEGAFMLLSAVPFSPLP